MNFASGQETLFVSNTNLVQLQTLQRLHFFFFFPKAFATSGHEDA